MNNVSLLSKINQNMLIPRGYPYFIVPVGSIGVINSPSEFYSRIIESIRGSRFRISLSTLYLGTGHLEKYLINELLKASNENKYLKIKIVMDKFRGKRINRDRESSFSLLKDMYLKSSNPQNLTFSFFHHNDLPLNYNFFNRGGSAEIMGTFHSKSYLFDNTVIISGANLSEEYFTHRTDRYMYFKDSVEVIDYIDDFIEITSDLGEQINSNDNEEIQFKNKKQLIHSFDKRFKLHLLNNQPNDRLNIFPIINNELFKEVQKNSSFDKFNKNNVDFYDIGTNLKTNHQYSSIELNIKQILSNVIISTKEPNIPVSDLDCSVVIPTNQISMIKKNEEEKMFMLLIDFIINLPITFEADLTFTTGYFNPPDYFINKIKEIKKNVKLTIITAAPKANSFYKAKGFKGIIPCVYRLALLKWIREFKNNENVTFLEYNLEDRTYHSKGLWLQINYGGETEYVTVYGSSNYGLRSFKKDLESQFWIFSNDLVAVKLFESERISIIKCSDVINEEIIVSDSDTKISLFNRFCYWLLRNFI